MHLSTKSYPAASIGDGTAYTRYIGPAGQNIRHTIHTTNSPGLLDQGTGHSECKQVKL